MKKNIPYLRAMLFCIMITRASFGAPELKVPEHDIGLGFIGGVNIGTMYGKGIDGLDAIYGKNSTSLRFSGNGSIAATYQFHKLLAAQTGLTFTGKGFKVLLAKDYSDGVTTERFLMRSVNHLELPLMVRLMLKKKHADLMSGAGKVTFHVFGGVGFDLVIAASDNEYLKYTYDSVSVSNSQNGKDKVANVNLLSDTTYTDSMGNKLHYSYNDYFRRADITAIVGCSVERRFDAVSIFLEFQYLQGLLNFNDVSERAEKELSNYTNSVKPYLISMNRDQNSRFRTYAITAGITIYLKAASYQYRLLHSEITY